MLHGKRKRLPAYRSYYANPEEFGLGGSIGSALGAVAGSVVPGVGTMVGSTVGGALGSTVDSMTAGNQRPANRGPAYSYGSSSLGAGYRKGGKKGYVEFEGPSHEQGGIDLGDGQEVEGGETMDYIELRKGGKVTKQGQPYIFSKTLKVPGSNMSFAKYHKQLKNRNADDEEIRQLAIQQEKIAGRVNKTSRTGGTMKKNNYKGGGRLKVGMNQGVGPYQMAGGYRWYRGGGKLSKKKYQEGGDFLFNTVNGMVQGGEEVTNPSEGGGMNWGSTALQVAPDLLNLATGVFGKDKTPPPVQVNQRALDDLPSRYNVNPILNKSAANYRAILADPNATSTQKLAAQSAKQQADSRAMAEKQNQESRMASRRAGMQADLDSQQSRFNAQARQDKMASEANLGLTGNFARQSLSSIANKILQMKKDKKLTQRDKELINMMIEGYGASPSHTNYLRNLSNQ